MELRTYTGLWKVEKRLHKFYDINLPYPVSVRQIIILVSAFIPWLIIMNLLNVPFAPPFGHLIWLAPPVLITWMANRPVAEGKTIYEFLWSQLSYLLNSKRYMGLKPTSKEPIPENITATVWSARN